MGFQHPAAEARIEGAQLTVAPKIADRSRSFKANVAPFHIHCSAAAAKVEQGDIIGAVPVVGIPDLLLGIHRYRMGGMPGLIDGDNLIIGQQLQSIIIQPRHIVSDIELCCRHCPEGHGRLTLIFRQSVHGTVPGIQGVKIIPASGTGISPPDGRVREQSGNIGPLGQSYIAVIGLNIPLNPPAVGILFPEIHIVMVQSPGKLEPDIMPCQSLGPGLDVSACVTAEIVDARPGSHAVELHEVNAPFPKKIGNGVDVLLRTGVAEVDFVGVGVPVIHNFQRLRRNIAYPAFPVGPVDFKVFVIRFNRQARNQINSDLLPIVVHIINNLLKTVRITPGVW
ncbi:hypothetical protein D3C75_595960 [compost metagenome]